MADDRLAWVLTAIGVTLFGVVLYAAIRLAYPAPDVDCSDTGQEMVWSYEERGCVEDP